MKPFLSSSHLLFLPSLRRSYCREDFMGAYMGYLANIAGFFIIEDSITKSGSALMTRTELDGLWEKSLIKIKSVLAEHIDQITDVSDFLALKYALVLFARTMESYSLSPNAIHDFLMVTTDRFERLILSRLHDEVKDALSNDKFEPLTVSNHSEYRSKVLAFGLQDPSLHVTFPATLPFSQSVPQVSKAVRAYASAYFEYAAHLPTSLESVICKSVDTVLITEVNAALNAMVNTAVTMHISQAVQISINAAFLAEACLYMQVYLSSYSEPTVCVDTSDYDDVVVVDVHCWIFRPWFSFFALAYLLDLNFLRFNPIPLFLLPCLYLSFLLDW